MCLNSSKNYIIGYTHDFHQRGNKRQMGLISCLSELCLNPSNAILEKNWMWQLSWAENNLLISFKLCQPYKCGCGADVDERYTHDLNCQKSAGRFSTHSASNDILKMTPAFINVSSILEPFGMLCEDSKKPDGLSLIPRSTGKAYFGTLDAWIR